MSSPYDDPNYRPPADIQGAKARAYEETILKLMREPLLPDQGTSVITLQAIELRGERPDTEVIFIHTDSRDPGRLYARRTFLWRDPHYKHKWVSNDDYPPWADTLQAPYLVAAAVGSAWQADELASIEMPEDSELRR